MNELNLTEGDLSIRKEIIQLLKMAITQQWAFSYVKAEGKKVTAVPIELVGIKADEGIFTVSYEPSLAQLESSAPPLFRAQSGGMSVIFQSLHRESAEPDAAVQNSSLLRFELPYKIACTQLRRTVRVNLEAITEVPVILYLLNGSLIEGKVIDISTSGAKIKVDKDLGQELQDPQSLDACKISLSEDKALRSGAQLIGMVNDAENFTSYLRCQFVHMRPEAEEILDDFISALLKKLGSFADSCDI